MTTRLAVLLCLMAVPAMAYRDGGLNDVFDQFYQLGPNVGCNVTSLPGPVDWCNVDPNKYGMVKPNSVCQSDFELLPFYTCYNGTWSKHWDFVNTAPQHRRLRRNGIGLAVSQLQNHACTRFCTSHTTGTNPRQKPPYFTYCSPSITIHPEDPFDSNETFLWRDPEAEDPDGTILDLQLLNANDTPSTFVFAIRPGNKHQVTYIAKDNDFLTWSCSFPIIAEVRTCPPIVHPDNGNTTCSHDNIEGSNCTFECNAGYQLVGPDWVVCEAHEEWSAQSPTCVAVTCDTHPDNTTSIQKGQFVCGLDQGDLYSVCRVQCEDTYTLRNDQFEEETVARLTLDIMDTKDDLQTAEQEREAAYLAYQQANSTAVILAEQQDITFSVLQEASANLTTAMQQLETANLTYLDSVAAALLAEQEAAEAVDKGFQNVTELQDRFQSMVRIRDSAEVALNESLLMAELAEGVNMTYSELFTNASTAALEAAIENTTAHEVFQQGVSFVASLEIQLADLETELASVKEIFAHDDKVINSYALCNENGTWTIQGAPMCVDLQPPTFRCEPLLTVYLENGTSSVLYDWSAPAVQDNSGLEVNVSQISGPEPGAALDVGLHKVEYVATDAYGNESPVCGQIISIQDMYCGSPSPDISDSKMRYECTGYTFGESCDLSCEAGYRMDGEGTIMCVRDDTVSPARFHWNAVSATCTDISECLTFEAPDNGAVNCENRTSGLTCAVTCNHGYVLPYKAVDTFVCDGAGSWFPAISGQLNCLEAGEQQYTEYTLRVLYPVDDCLFQDLESVRIQFANSLESRLPAFDTCTVSYSCSVNFLSVTCEDDVTGVSNMNITFSVLVTCSDVTVPSSFAMLCDLTDDSLAQSLVDDVTSDIETGNILGYLNNNDTVSDNTVSGITIDTPECGEGSVLVAAYCERCQTGYFYNPTRDLCDPCPVGQYNVQPGLTSCSQCPAGTSTVSTGSTSKGNCRAECPPGTYSPGGGLEPCLQCEMGHYQEGASSTSCSMNCPAGRSTVILGSSTSIDCVPFDMYFERDVSSLHATTETLDQVTIALWTWSLDRPRLTIGVFNSDSVDDPTFVLDVSDGKMEILFDGWDNAPIDTVTMETGTWTILVLTWDRGTGVGRIYKDGDNVIQLQFDPATRSASQSIFIGARAGTVISGLSIANQVADRDTVARLVQSCSVVPPSAFFTTGSFESSVLRRAGIKHIPTLCNASNSAFGAETEQCQLHVCQNGAGCNSNSTGYTCVCTEAFTGPFCSIPVVDGGWSPWYNETGCSVTCGKGVQRLYRFCNNPYPGRDGDACPGNDTDIVECLLDPCPECTELTDESGTRCVMGEDEVCMPFCPRGRVLPKGQHDIQYRCGKATGYQWVPLQTLPVCAESVKPEGYSSTLQFTVTPAVPCSLVDILSSRWTDVLQNTSCPVNNSACTFSITISECDSNATTGRRKRQEPVSGLEVVYNIVLTDTSPFDLSTYYNNSQEISESIQEAVLAILHLETVSTDLETNPSQLNVLHNNVLYVINFVATNVLTSCSSGFLPIEGVCAACQAGTHDSAGWCVFCGLGTFKTTQGPSDCTPCPVGKTTQTIGTRTPVLCVDDPTYVATTAPTTPPTAASSADEINIAMIIGIVIGGVVIIVIIIVLVVMKLKKGKRDELKGSQILNFGDENFNLTYKRRHVMGFDQDGDPVLSSDAILQDHELEPFPNESGEAPLNQGLVVWPPVNQGPFVVKNNKMDPLSLGDGPFNACKVQALHEETFNMPKFVKEDRDPLPKMRGIDRFRVPGRNRPLPLPIAVYENGRIVLKTKPIPETAYTSPRVPFPPSVPPLKFTPPGKLVTLGLPPVNKDNTLEDHNLTDEDYHTGEEEEDALMDPAIKGPARFLQSFSKSSRSKSHAASKTKKATALLKKIGVAKKNAKPPDNTDIKDKKRKVLKLIDGKRTETYEETAPDSYVPMVFNREGEGLQVPSSDTQPQSKPTTDEFLKGSDSPELIPPPTIPKVFDVTELKTWPTTLTRSLQKPSVDTVPNRTSTPDPKRWQNGVMPLNGGPHLTQSDKKSPRGNSSDSGNAVSVSPRDVTMVGDSKSSIMSTSSSKEKLSAMLFPPSKVYPENKVTRSNSLRTEGPEKPVFNSLPRRKDSEDIDEGAIPSFKQSVKAEKDAKISVSLERRLIEGGPLNPVVNKLPSHSSPWPDPAGTAQYVGLHNSTPAEDHPTPRGQIRRVPSDIEIS